MGSHGVLLDDVSDVHLGHLLTVGIGDLLLLLDRGGGGWRRGRGQGRGLLLLLPKRGGGEGCPGVTWPRYLKAVVVIVLLGNPYLILLLLRAGTFAVGSRSHLVPAETEQEEREERWREGSSLLYGSVYNGVYTM